jgi:hypothetical protein
MVNGPRLWRRTFMRKSVSVARRARYNSSRSLRLWKTALPRDGDLGRRFRSPPAWIWRIAVRAMRVLTECNIGIIVSEEL